jgi:hypothetical protein
MSGRSAAGLNRCPPRRCGRKSAYSGAVADILSWWDGVELWLSGLPFVLQTIVVMPVVLALAYGIAILLDGALAQAARLLRWVRNGEPNGRQ